MRTSQGKAERAGKADGPPGGPLEVKGERREPGHFERSEKSGRLTFRSRSQTTDRRFLAPLEMTRLPARPPYLIAPTEYHTPNSRLAQPNQGTTPLTRCRSAPLASA